MLMVSRSSHITFSSGNRFCDFLIGVLGVMSLQVELCYILPAYQRCPLVKSLLVAVCSTFIKRQFIKIVLIQPCTYSAFLVND